VCVRACVRAWMMHNGYARSKQCQRHLREMWTGHKDEPASILSTQYARVLFQLNLLHSAAR